MPELEGLRRPGSIKAQAMHLRPRPHKTMPTTVIHVRDMREGDIYIGHRFERYSLPESIWANPHYKDDCSQEEKVQRFEAYILAKPELLAQLHTLRGKRLACWCKPKACHGDVLARLAEAL